MIEIKEDLISPQKESLYERPFLIGKLLNRGFDLFNRILQII
jgi:hypothetical protein